MVEALAFEAVCEDGVLAIDLPLFRNKLAFVVVARLQVRIFFCFQAEDGIRYHWVTGVQTCALPISLVESVFLEVAAASVVVLVVAWVAARLVVVLEIGRASCRERV